MKSTVSFRRLLPLTAALAVAASLVLVAPVSAQAPEGAFDRTLRVSGAVDLDIVAGSGSIRIEPGAADSVRVAARLKAGNSWVAGGDVEKRIRQIEQNPPIEQQGNVIRVGHFADRDLPRNISISYEVTVPADTKLAASAGSGSITVGAIKGPARLQSGSGGVTVGRVGGSVQASTGSGSIKVGGAASLEASTGSGSVHAAAVSGPTKAHSGSGSITVSQTGKGDVDVSASSGSITLTGVDGAARANSASGSIRIDGRPGGPGGQLQEHPGLVHGVPRQGVEAGTAVRPDDPRNPPDGRRQEPLPDDVPGRVHAVSQAEREVGFVDDSERAREVGRGWQRGPLTAADANRVSGP